ncbi:MAG TPA: CBS domain-containing protein [Actinomycetota bacterium]|jgi:CBS domain-containing protein|nr:CBS domain-containing protein [Actinomycetota bacterium]
MDVNGGFRRMLQERFGRVREAMTSSVVELEPSLLAAEAVRLLSEAGVTGGPVVEDGRVVGIVTLSDLIGREHHAAAHVTGPFLRSDRQLGNLKVTDVMTREVVTACEDWPLVRAIVTMDDAGVNRLPVLDAFDHPVGILARDDVVRAVAAALRWAERAEEHGAQVPDWTLLEAD